MAPRLMMKLDNENEDEDVIVDKLLRTVWSWTRAQLKRRGGEWTLNLIFLFVFVMAIVIRPSALARIGLISFKLSLFMRKTLCTSLI